MDGNDALNNAISFVLGIGATAIVQAATRSGGPVRRLLAEIDECGKHGERAARGNAAGHPDPGAHYAAVTGRAQVDRSIKKLFFKHRDYHLLLDASFMFSRALIHADPDMGPATLSPDAAADAVRTKKEALAGMVQRLARSDPRWRMSRFFAAD